MLYKAFFSYISRPLSTHNLFQTWKAHNWVKKKKELMTIPQPRQLYIKFVVQPWLYLAYHSIFGNKSTQIMRRILFFIVKHGPLVIKVVQQYIIRNKNCFVRPLDLLTARLWSQALGPHEAQETTKLQHVCNTIKWRSALSVGKLLKYCSYFYWLWCISLPFLLWNQILREILNYDRARIYHQHSIHAAPLSDATFQAYILAQQLHTLLEV